MPHSKTCHSHQTTCLEACNMLITNHYIWKASTTGNESQSNLLRKVKTSDLWSNIKLSPWRVRIGSLLIFWCVTFVVPHIPDRFKLKVSSPGRARGFGSVAVVFLVSEDAIAAFATTSQHLEARLSVQVWRSTSQPSKRFWTIQNGASSELQSNKRAKERAT